MSKSKRNRTLDSKAFHWVCTETGELQETIPGVIRATIVDLVRYRFLHKWQYNKGGY